MQTKAIKAIGRKASKCRKCGSEVHWVNKLGGLACVTCAPAKQESQVVATLVIRDGIWADATVPDEWDCSPSDSREAGVGNTGGNSGYEGTESLVSTTNVCADHREILDRQADLQAQRHQDVSYKVEGNGGGSGGSRSSQPIIPTVLAYQRGPNGELSGFELELFASEELWGSPLNPDDPHRQWVTLKPKVRMVNRLGRRPTTSVPIPAKPPTTTAQTT